MVAPSMWRSLAPGGAVETIMSPRYSRAALLQEDYWWHDILLVPDRYMSPGEAEIRRHLTGQPVAPVVFD